MLTGFFFKPPSLEDLIVEFGIVLDIHVGIEFLQFFATFPTKPGMQYTDHQILCTCLDLHQVYFLLAYTQAKLETLVPIKGIARVSTPPFLGILRFHIAPDVYHLLIIS